MLFQTLYTAVNTSTLYRNLSGPQMTVNNYFQSAEQDLSFPHALCVPAAILLKRAHQGSPWILGSCSAAKICVSALKQ